MKSMLLLAQELLMLYGIGLIGYIAKRGNILNEHTDQVLTQLILYITLPSLILYSMDFSYSSEQLLHFGQLILLSGYALMTACLGAYFMSRQAELPESRSGVYQSLIIFGNQGFIGYAVCYILFAESGIVYAAVFNLLYLILIWSYCPLLIGKGRVAFSWQNILLSPGILATGLGLFLWILPIQWPFPVLKLLESVGQMTIPLSMIMIGGLLANLKGKELWSLIRSRQIWYASLAKLAGIPLLLLPAFLLPVPFTLIAVAVLITASPSAPTTSLFAQKYQADVYFASVGVLVSTLLAILTIPLLYAILLWIK